MENEIVKKEEGKKIMNKKSTYFIFITTISFLINILNGNIAVFSIIGAIVGSIIFAYPIYYIYQAIRYKRWNVGDKQVFETGVLRVASVLALLVCLSVLRVILS